MEALHKLDEREGSVPGQQLLQLLGADHYHRIPPANGDALRSLALGQSHHLAEPSLGVLELSPSVRLDGFEAGSMPCPILHLAHTRFI